MLTSTPSAPCDRHVLEQRARHGRAGRIDGAVRAGAAAGAHERVAAAGHDALDVGEVEVHEPGHRDQFGDALGRLQQHVVRDRERVGQRRAPCPPPTAGARSGSRSACPPRRAVRRDPRRPGACGAGPRTANGLVTTATVSAPAWRASRATTGAEPVPVPPPMPAVMNTMSASATASAIACSSSSAARRPVCGSPPEPRPRVVLSADLDARRRQRLRQRLHVGVGDDELHAAQACADHAIDGVAAGATATDDLEPGRVAAVDLEFERGHDHPPWCGLPGVVPVHTRRDGIRIDRRTSCEDRNASEPSTRRPRRNPPHPPRPSRRAAPDRCPSRNADRRHSRTGHRGR